MAGQRELGPEAARSAWPHHVGATLRAYFYSGWAFLVPYLFTYLLYAWLDWPVTRSETNIGFTDPRNGAMAGSIPPLIRVYWVIHGAHMVLVAFAVRSWFRTVNSPVGARTPGAAISIAEGTQRLLPWIGLAIVFYIPGLYIEWPSDPWEHLRRINEWHVHNTVASHATWIKSSYFLPYSLTQSATGLTQLRWLNVYCTAVSLLLGWQYYRLARTTGLNSRAGFLLAVMSALTLGNDIFSFYRYYGLSSTIFAQIGAVGLTRISIELSRQEGTSRSNQTRPHDLRCRRGRAVVAIIVLGFLTAFNHIQGIGVAGIGVLAVIVWRLVEWRRSALVWILSASLLTSIATVLWYPRHAALDELFVARGWLTSWYSFNLFTPTSPAFERTLQLVGVIGFCNALVGTWLIVKRNDVAGWLTLMPFLVLLTPCCTVPFLHALATESNPENIITFHRLFLAGPPSIALLAALTNRNGGRTRVPHPHWACAHLPVQERERPDTSQRHSAMAASSLLLLLLLLSFPAGSTYNRTWHLLHKSPADSSQVAAMRDFAAVGDSLLGLGYKLSAREPLDYVFAALGVPRLSTPENRRIDGQPAHYPSRSAELFVHKGTVANVAMYFPDRFAYTTSGSLAASLSKHWLPQESLLLTVGVPEAEQSLNRNKLGFVATNHMPSSARLVQHSFLPDSVITLSDGLRLSFLGVTTERQSAHPERWLRFRRAKTSGMMGFASSGERRFFSGRGRYAFGLNLLPTEGGADVLLRIDTLQNSDAIYLIHHRSGNRYYYYVGRSEIGPWIAAAPIGQQHEFEFVWENGHQSLVVDGVQVLQSSLEMRSELVTDIFVGSEPNRPERSLHGDLLIRDLALITE